MSWKCLAWIYGLHSLHTCGSLVTPSQLVMMGELQTCSYKIICTILRIKQFITFSAVIYQVFIHWKKWFLHSLLFSHCKYQRCYFHSVKITNNCGFTSCIVFSLKDLKETQSKTTKNVIPVIKNSMLLT